MIDFNCQKCGFMFSVPDSLVGQPETCPDCGTQVTVPPTGLEVPPPSVCGAVASAKTPPRVQSNPSSQPLPMEPAEIARPAVSACARPVQGKSPGVALILSLVIVGLGQFYNEDNKKGGVMLGLAVLGGLMSAGILWFAAAAWSAIDAYQVASGKAMRWS